MKSIQLALLTLFTSQSASTQGDYVVLLHGLGRSRFAMKRLEWSLRGENYRVINVSYPSTRQSIPDLANVWLPHLLNSQAPDPAVKIHFVTHSLGGIIVRQFLAEHQLNNLGRVVMLAPPNQGSDLVDKLRNNRLYRLLTGPAGQQLGTDTQSTPQKLGPANFELGIIAGDRSFNPLFSSWISGPDDGKVSVRSAQLPGMRDFLVTHHSHTWLPWRRSVISAAASFIGTGFFNSSGKPARTETP